MSTIIPVKPAGEQIPARDYTAELLRRAAAEETIPAARLETVRLVLFQKAAEYAAAYTQNRCSTVTKEQAESFFRSVFYQLDAALLPLHSDSAALAALRDADISVLLETGQRNIMTAYEEAKAAFRRAYSLTKPFATTFFRELLLSFEKFCTGYDARFQADAVTLNDFYPLLCRQSIPVGGVLGAHFYYTALLHEGELLAAFPRQEVSAVLRIYAKRYLTAPDMIADNLAELVLLQWSGAALCGGTALTLQLPESAADILNSRYQYSRPETVCADLRNAVSQSPLADHSGIYGYIYPLLDKLAGELHRYFSSGKAAVILPAPAGLP